MLNMLATQVVLGPMYLEIVTTHDERCFGFLAL